MIFKTSYLTYRHVGEYVEDFLKKYHSSFNSEQDFIEYLLSRPTKELYWYETQGDWFAGQLLVPTGQLERFCIDLLESNRDQF